MLNFFRKHTSHLKTNWFNYGLDTIVVIVGVLIALAMNNWNEQRKEEKELSAIYRIIAEDLESDILALDTLVLDFEWRMKYMEGIVYGTAHIEEWVKNDSLLYSLVAIPDFQESERGLSLLKSKITITGETGSLTTLISTFYNKRLLKITLNRNDVQDILKKNTMYWSENTDWIILAVIDGDSTLLSNYAQHVQNNPKFRNRVLNYYASYNSYIEGLKEYSDDGKLMFKEINNYLKDK